jgi:hypothetical protein
MSVVRLPSSLLRVDSPHSVDSTALGRLRLLHPRAHRRIRIAAHRTPLSSIRYRSVAMAPLHRFASPHPRAGSHCCRCAGARDNTRDKWNLHFNMRNHAWSASQHLERVNIHERRGLNNESTGVQSRTAATVTVCLPYAFVASDGRMIKRHACAYSNGNWNC